MKKKLFLIALIMSSLFMSISCVNQTEKSIEPDVFLIKEGIFLTCKMDELAESKEYISIMTPSAGIVKIAENMAFGDYSIPEDAYLIKLQDDITTGAIRALSGDLNISDNVMEIIQAKMINGSVFANMINASYGSEMIAATAITTTGKSYIQPNGWSDNIIVLLKYSGEFSGIISFSRSGEGVITGASVFVKNGDVDILTLLGEYLGTTDIEYVHYSKDRLQDILVK